MTRFELAAKLNGREYGPQPWLTKNEEQQAKENGLVIISGYSDDLVSFYGAIQDERNPGVTHVRLDNSLGKKQDGSFRIKGEFSPKSINADWLITTDVPHSVFNIMEDGRIYCRAIIIDLNEVR